MANQICAIFCACFMLIPFCYVSCDNKDVWAILVSGTDDWRYYAMEAATYKTYQLLRTGGIPAQNIIVLSSDIVSFHSKNPYPGNVYYGTRRIIPESGNVYDGVRIDYAAENCTAENFLAVLSGNKNAVTSGSRRVLQSGPKSTVLISYAGLGGSGYIRFPNYEAVFAEELVQLIEKLRKEFKFHKLLFTMDTTRAGSNFDNYLSSNKHILGITATGKDSSMYACAPNSELGVYTAPCFSYRWLNIVEKNQQQKNGSRVICAFNSVRHILDIIDEVSIPQMYGQIQTSYSQLSDFYGRSKIKSEQTNLKEYVPQEVQKINEEESELFPNGLNDILKEKYVNKLGKLDNFQKKP